MITTTIGPDEPFLRAIGPKWSRAPESGLGAALKGGRFNRPGISARYLSRTSQTALLEYQGELALLPPATVVTFLVTAANVVDFSGGYTPELWPEIWVEAYCNWKELAFLKDIEPPSWIIGDLVRKAGHPGILYRSARDPNGVCLVLFPEMAEATGFKAPAHDPSGDLSRRE